MAAPNWISLSELVHVPYAAAPLSKIGENANHLYRYHSPPIVNLALVNSAATSREWVFAMPASADGIVYRVEVAAWSSQSDTAGATLYAQAGASTGAWGSAVAQQTGLAINGNGWFNSVGFSGTLPAGTTHGKLTLAATSGNIRGHSVIVYPDAPLTLPTAETTAGFVPYTATVLESVTGAPIHREMINRIANNVRVVMRDRPQAVLGVADTSTAATFRFTSGSQAAHVVGLTGAHLPGQAGATLTVRYRITDTTGSASKVWLHELGGSSLELTVDDTDRTGTLTLASAQPAFKIVALPGTALEIKYIQADWTPGD